jgi:predicted metal-dependent peptidase
MAEKDIQARRLSVARVQLLIHYPFWGHLALNLEPTPKTGLQFGTMATDGYRLYYDPEGAMVEWSDDELKAAVAHETAHCAFSHMMRKGVRQQLRWNMATDFVINNLLDLDNLKMPKGTLLDHQYDNMSSEEIYNKLPEDAGQCNGNHSQDGSGPPCDGSCGSTFDDPSTWEKSGKVGEEEEGSGSYRDENFWKDKVTQAATAAKLQGKLPSHLNDLVDELLEPKMNWRDLLHEYVNFTIKDNYRFTPPSRKYLYMPMYMPSLYGEHIELVVAIDTSGSTIPYQQQFISEVFAIAANFNSFTIHYMQCDAAVDFYQEMTLEDRDNWPMIVTGRGGTSFRPVFEKVEELGLNPPLLIYLTDLDGSFPNEEPPYPTLWITTENSDPPFGDTILMND